MKSCFVFVESVECPKTGPAFRRRARLKADRTPTRHVRKICPENSIMDVSNWSRFAVLELILRDSTWYSSSLAFES